MTSGEVTYSNTVVKTNKVALFERKPRQISFVLVDSILSHRDGNRLARLIRKNRISVPIFVVSGNHGITQEFVKLGAGMEGNLTNHFIALNCWPTMKPLSGKPLFVVSPWRVMKI